MAPCDRPDRTVGRRLTNLLSVVFALCGSSVGLGLADMLLALSDSHEINFWCLMLSRANRANWEVAGSYFQISGGRIGT